MGAMDTSRGMKTGQVVSRAVPVPGPMVEQGVQAAMADQGCRAAMADQGIRAAMADQGTRAAMADQEIRAAMADLGPPWAMVGSPPKQNSWVDFWPGALGKCGFFRALGKR